MIKVTVECDGCVGSSSVKDAVTITDALECFEHAVRACGFVPKGHIEFVEEE